MLRWGWSSFALKVGNAANDSREYVVISVPETASAALTDLEQSLYHVKEALTNAKDVAGQGRLTEL